jgi:biopolymer transport protein ExbB
MGAFQDRSRMRWFKIAFLSLLTAYAFLFVASSLQPAHAQDQPAAGATDNTPAPEESLFLHIIKSAGPIFGPILLLVSISLVTLVVMLAMDLRMSNCIPPDFVEEFTDAVNKRRFKEAFEMARGETSFVGKVLAAGMGRLQYGLEDAREAALNAVENIRASKDQILTYVATIGTLGPMIGLVGTVFGMIVSFMALSGGGTPKPAELASGISKALVITLLGIAIAVPAIFCHAFFRNRLIKVSMESATIADDLLTQMYHLSRKPAPAGEARTAPSANAEPRAAAAIKPAQ